MKNLTTQEISLITIKTGIYKIRINNKEYIGSSRNLKSRLRHHLRSLKRNEHHNKTMQNLYNKYKDVYFEIIEECNVEELLIREFYYIKLISPYINHILDPLSNERDEIYKKRLSNGLKKTFKQGRQIHNKRKVYKYDLSGVYLEEYESIIAARNSVGAKSSGAIVSVCKNQTTSANGFIWSYNKLETIVPKSSNYKVKKVTQLTLDGEIIKEWDSATEVLSVLGISNINRAIKNNLTAGGYKWKFT